jgi:aconitase B
MSTSIFTHRASHSFHSYLVSFISSLTLSFFLSAGYYSTYGKVGARTEMPGCSLCMGNQARVAEKSTVVSTSTRNFPNRLGKGADVFLASAELAAVAAIEGKYLFCCDVVLVV